MKEKNKRVVVYIPPSLFRRIKISVATQGIDLSEWVRRKAQEEVGGKGSNNSPSSLPEM